MIAFEEQSTYFSVRYILKSSVFNNINELNVLSKNKHKKLIFQVE